MNKIPIISQNTLSTLFNNVENNTSAYLGDNLAQLLEGSVKELTDTSIDDGLSSKLIWEKDEREGILDAKNSGILFKSLHGITPYQARDERILAAISHIYLREYTIQRHKIGGSDIDKIKRHFFARGNGFEASSEIIQLVVYGGMVISWHDVKEKRILMNYLNYYVATQISDLSS